jgi:hypothetical protein
MSLPGTYLRRTAAGQALPLVLSCVLFALPAAAQTGGEAGIQGSITDAQGAVVPNAEITAVNQNTGVVTVRKASADGLYTISPILPGTYKVTVKMPGFQTYTQENFTIDALKMTGLNIKLSIGSTTEEITVSAAPPQLETTNATLGGVIENQTYTNLPIQMSGQQRDATAFATLLPGAQSGSRAPVIGGTTNYSTELFLDGMPVTIATQQGDNRVIFNSVPVEAVEQFQVLTSSIPAEYQGAGVLNFTVKSGQQQYHGSANIFLRNTILDTWTYTAKQATAPNAAGVQVPIRKPYENQNEISAQAGGPIPLTKKRGFFEFTYDRFHGRAGVTPGLLTVPTTQMQAGNFSQLLSANGGPGYVIYDPTTEAACTSHNTNRTPCRYAYGQSYAGTPGANGNPTGTATNMIPAAQISPIAQAMQKYLPTPTSTALQNNYLGGLPSGYDNYSYVWRADFDLTANQRLSFINTKGNRLNVPYTFGANPTLPLPYARATEARVVINIANVEHAWTIRPWLVNQAKFSFLQMGGPPITNPTQGISGYQASTDLGIGNLPAGQASQEFPSTTFTGNFAPTQWGNGASGATQTSVSNAYTYVDNLLIVKGKHSITTGFELQYLQANASAADGASTPLNLGVDATATAGIASSSALTANTGYNYASFLLGGITTGSTSVQSFSITGGRYRAKALYGQDDWKITPKLTLNLGLRWDYLPPFTEEQNRWSFLNPNLTNPVTGNAGALQFAGNQGAGNVSCHCSTPVSTYWKNFGPRIGFSYELDQKTVIRGGYGISYSHGGGVGGRNGSYQGTGNLGYSVTAAATNSTTEPAFYLNNSAGFAAAGMANTNFGGPNYVLPTPVGPTAAAQALNVGNYVSSTGGYVTPLGVSYADPYISGRAPEFIFFNFGVQHAVTNNITLSVNYAGSQSHFLVTGATSAGPARGFASNQLDPKYVAGLGSTYVGSTPILSALGNAANLKTAQAAMAGVASPYPGFTQAAGLGGSSNKATIQQMLLPFPQFSGITDTWGQDIGNNSYNSLQVSLQQRAWHGVTYQANYTYAKNLGDDGTFRSGYAIPAGAIDGGGNGYRMGYADRSPTTISVPQNLSIFGTAQSPWGKNGFGGDSKWVRAFAGGWMLSGIFGYHSGVPLAVTVASCNSFAGTCMPDVNPAHVSSSARINGSWSDGATGKNVGALAKIDASAFVQPSIYGTQATCGTTCVTRIGNAARTRPFNLVNPSYYNLDMGLKREFPLTRERFKLQLEANALNVTNKHTFGGINTTLAAADNKVGSPTFGSYAATNGTTSSFGKATTATGNRDWQLAAHINF